MMTLLVLATIAAHFIGVGWITRIEQRAGISAPPSLMGQYPYNLVLLVTAALLILTNDTRYETTGIVVATIGTAAFYLVAITRIKRRHPPVVK